MENNLDFSSLRDKDDNTKKVGSTRDYTWFIAVNDKGEKFRYNSQDLQFGSGNLKNDNNGK